jgi:hypothetical protein
MTAPDEPTPRTDAALKAMGADDAEMMCQISSLARTLERELAAAQEIIEMYKYLSRRFYVKAYYVDPALGVSEKVAIEGAGDDLDAAIDAARSSK